MKRLLFVCALVFMTGQQFALARPGQGELLDRLLSIADPDQVQAYEKLDLTPGQMGQLRQVAVEFLPQIEQAQKIPGGHLLLVPEALRRVDGILTPTW